MPIIGIFFLCILGVICLLALYRMIRAVRCALLRHRYSRGFYDPQPEAGWTDFPPRPPEAP